MGSKTGYTESSLRALPSLFPSHCAPAPHMVLNTEQVSRCSVNMCWMDEERDEKLE